MSKTTNKFSSEVRARAVRLVLDNEAQHLSRWQAVMSIAAKIGCTPQTLNDWVKKAEVDSGRRAGIPAEMAEKMKALKNPIRREFHLFLLLSGHRPDAIKRARVEHVDFRTRILHVPKPKGGEAKAFDIPLSRAMVLCLIRGLRIGRVMYPAQSREWLFPAESESSHITERKEKRHDLPKWGNDLRQTYRTVAQAAGIPELAVHLLMNHSIPGVNAGDITRNKLLSDHLRLQQEAISRRILEAAVTSPNGSNAGQSHWCAIPSRRIVADLTEASRAAN